MHASVLTEVDEATVLEVTATVESLAAQLEQERRTAMPGADVEAFRRGERPYNPVIGHANPIAPPLTVRIVGPGQVEGDVTFAPIYEGPPRAVHGGWVATVLDQLLGHAIASAGVVGFTGELSVRYRRPTPHSVPLLLRSRAHEVDGRRITASGEIVVDGQVTAEATGVFVIPSEERKRELLAGLKD